MRLLHQPQKLAGERNVGTTWLGLVSIALVALLSVASPQTHAQIGGVVSDTIGTLFLVTTLDDHDDGACDDDCTLREAIDYANARSGHDGIRSGVTGTINLQSALPPIFDDLTITGPGADLLTVRRDTGGDYVIFSTPTPVNNCCNNHLSVTLANMTITNGSVGISNLYPLNTLNIINCTLDANGVGAHNRGVTLNVTNSRFTNNFAGGINTERFYANGNINVTDSTFSNNTSSYGGGAINNGSGTAQIRNSTFRRNSARFGGAIYNYGYNIVNGAMDIFNSTFSGNVAVGKSDDDDDGGGAIRNDGGEMRIFNSTLTGNIALHGGGIRTRVKQIYGQAYVISSIVAANIATAGEAPDLDGDFTSGGFNLIGATDGSTGFTAATDQTGTGASRLDPKLDPAGLQDHGGPTQTLALQPDSPAIDKGTSNSLTTDQRGTGFLRAFDDPLVANATGGDGADIGAFEAQPGTGDANSNGIPDNADPDTLAAVIVALPVADFHISGNKNAFLRKLGDIKQLILAGDIDQAVEEWRDLRRHADGCGAATAADKNDWITSCASQPPVRAFIDFLAANLLR